MYPVPFNLPRPAKTDGVEEVVAGLQGRPADAYSRSVIDSLIG